MERLFKAAAMPQKSRVIIAEQIKGRSQSAFSLILNYLVDAQIIMSRGLRTSPLAVAMAPKV